MNKFFVNMNKVVLALIVCGSASFAALASDLSPSDIAYEHYVCGAYEQYGADDADMKAKCGRLANDGFDLDAWEAANKDQSIKLQQEAFSIFF